ncbi:hypothetical protein FB451DRAFT_1549066 [Mycena latifolia]|nr:hypothetical protein FB451DRAFT_1549066 [Mycena latifolia]
MLHLFYATWRLSSSVTESTGLSFAAQPLAIRSSTFLDSFRSKTFALSPPPPPEPTSLALLLPNFDCGVSKYEPGLAYLAEEIIHLVGIIEQVALRTQEELRLMDLTPDRADPEACWEYFETLRDAIELKLTTTGIRARLEAVKLQYSRSAEVSRHLRTLKADYSNTVAAPDTVAAPYEIPGITQCQPKGHLRVAQYEEIMSLARLLARGGMNLDPYHLIPFQFRNDMFGEGYKDWFFSRDDHIRISASAKAYGNSQAAYDKAIAGQQRFAADKPEASAKLKITEELFPSIIRLSFLHDIFNNPLLSTLIPSLSSVGLRQIAVQEVMERPGSLDVLLKAFPGAQISRIVQWPSIYVRATDPPDSDLELNLAIDSILPMLSTCPSSHLPTDAKQRGAPWGSTRAAPEHWVGKHLMRCDYGTLARRQEKTQKNSFLATAMSRIAELGPRDCQTQNAFIVTSLLQLPPEYLRRFWFQTRIFPRRTPNGTDGKENLKAKRRKKTVGATLAPGKP